MTRRSPNPRAVSGLLLAVLLSSIASPVLAQQTALRGGQSPGPRFIVPTLVSDGTRLGFQVANAVRERIMSDFDMRALWVVPESTITKYLTDAGYPPDQPLSTSETRQLASSFGATELLNGTVVKTPSGGYRVQAAWSLGTRDDMVQPLPAVEAAKISDVAKLVAHEFQAARKQIESVQRCVTFSRARNFAGALAEARKAIDVYPKSVLGRVCIANIYEQQGLGPDSMIRISEEILAIHPGNGRALAFAADAYGAKELTQDQTRVLERLLTVDPTSHRVRLALARAYAGGGKPDAAQPLVDSTVVQDPQNVEAVNLQWRVHLATKDWAGAVRIGEALIAIDTSAATRDFFVRMIAAADAAGDAPNAVQLATRGVARFPADDELALLQVQFLRRTGQLPAALAAVNALVARSPRAQGAWLQKARIESESGMAADTILATLARGIENGENRSLVARYARTLGQTTAKASMDPKDLDGLRTATRYLKAAESAQANDTTAYVLGTTSLSLGRRLYSEARTAKRCDLAKEMQQSLVDAQISLLKGGRVFPVQTPQLLTGLAEAMAFADQLAKSVCR
jgi:tetratricopeptide (TPR) repeat protein